MSTWSAVCKREWMAHSVFLKAQRASDRHNLILKLPFLNKSVALAIHLFHIIQRIKLLIFNQLL